MLTLEIIQQVFLAPFLSNSSDFNDDNRGGAILCLQSDTLVITFHIDFLIFAKWQV